MVNPTMTEILSKTESEDLASLCGSKHTFKVAYSSDGSSPKPIQDYIVVSFSPEDTSGGGWIEEQFQKLISATVDGFVWVKDNTVVAAGNGMADWSRDRGVVYGEGVEGGFAKGYKETVDNSGAWVKKQSKKLCGKYNPFCAEEVTGYAKSPFYSPHHFNSEFKTDWVGTEYHPIQASSHRIRIKIFCTYEGERKEMYDTELAGCSPLLSDDECLACCESVTIDQFLINSPGMWEVEITPVATGSCSSLDYTHTASFEVPEPADWKPSPVEASLRTLSDEIENVTGTRVSPAQIGLACAFLGGALLFKFYKKKKS